MSSGCASEVESEYSGHLAGRNCNKERCLHVRKYVLNKGRRNKSMS